MKRLVLALILIFAACDNLFPPQDFEPTGSPFSLNTGISLIGIAGDRRHFSPNGLYTLEMVAKSAGSAFAYDTLPAGLLFTSRKNSTQHMLMLKAHQITVGTSNTSLVLGVFCCNRHRLIPAEEDSFSLGPITDNPDLRQLADLVRNKRIADDLGMIQRAVYLITDSTGLTQGYIDSINALPSE